jgi:hypothetical protein
MYAMALGLALSLGAGAACAQPPAAPGAGARAIELGNEGVALYEQGKWAEALARFREAESYHHSPVFVLYAARSLRNAGRLLDARAVLWRLVSETLEASAPASWKEARAHGRVELDALEESIPSVVISIMDGSPATRVLIGDRPVAAGEPIELDPGVHRLIARDSGRTQVATFTLAPGARSERVVVRLTPIANPSRSRSADRVVADGKEGVYLPGVVVAATGGAAMLTGAVIGVLALRKKSDAEAALPASCAGRTCPRSRQIEIEERVRAARNLGTVADMLLIGGAAAVATGAALLLFNGGDGPAVRAGVSSREGLVGVRF